MAIPPQLGPYRLGQRLSSGAMGAVYEATHLHTGGRYALKVILGERGAALERFRREAETLARLNHPYIVRVHAAELEGQVPYLVQDLLAGGTLQEHVDRSPLPVDEAVQLCLKLADALSAAHAQGVLHRDLKPENVMFDDRGEPKLVDFGVAHVASAEVRLTQTGEFVGTPVYMAPEQCQAGPLDERTDVYGLGGLLYAALTGRPPLEPRSSVLTTLAAVAHDPVVPPTTLRAEIPPGVEAACLRALEKDANDRFPNAKAFAAALVARAPERPTRSLAAKVAIAAALAAVAVSLVALANRPAPPDAPGPRAHRPEPVNDAGALRRQALEALRSSDVAAARSATTLLRAGGGANDDLEGFVALLSGDLERAQTLLEGHPAGSACQLERRRLRLAALPKPELEAFMSQGAVARNHLSEIARLRKAAASVRALDPIGAALTERVQVTILKTVLEWSRLTSPQDWESLPKVLLDTRALDPNSRAAGALAVGSATFYAADSERPVPEDLARLLEHSLKAGDLHDRWRFAGLVIRSAHRGEVLPFADLPPTCNDWTKTETLAISEASREIARAWYAKLGAALQRCSPREATRAWRECLAFVEFGRAISDPASMAHSSARLNLIALRLLALQVDLAAEELARAPFYKSVLWERDILRNELDLLQDAPNHHRAAEERARAAIARLGTRRSSLLDIQLAAILFRRGQKSSAEAALASVVDGPSQLRGLRPPLWRTVAETRLEGADPKGAQGMRAYLRAALERTD